MRALAALLGVLLALVAAPAEAQFAGHGGPVRAVTVLADGRTLASGGFDQSVIVWDEAAGRPARVLRFHEGAVNALVALPGGGFASGAEDGRVAIWGAGPEPVSAFRVHDAPVSALAVTTDGARLVSAGWDGRIVVTRRADGARVEFVGHRGPVSAVALLADGERLASVGHDLTLRLWRLDGTEVASVTLPSAAHGLVALPGGDLAVGGADGVVRVLDARLGVTREADPLHVPIALLRLSPDGRTLAAAGLQGAVALIDVGTLRVRLTLEGPGLPVWSLAWLPDGRRLVTGGGDRLVRLWNTATGKAFGDPAPPPEADVLARFQGDRGAEVFRACAVCHTLTPDGGNRAGPTLHGVFGRRIATAPGYEYSAALKAMDIVWTAETIARLFEIGPSAYTPGTKMPEQLIRSAEDRAALVSFLDRATR